MGFTIRGSESLKVNQVSAGQYRLGQHGDHIYVKMTMLRPFVGLDLTLHQTPVACSFSLIASHDTRLH